MKLVAMVDGRAYAVEVERRAAGYRVTVDGEVWEVDARGAGPGIQSLLIGGVSHLARVSGSEGDLAVDVDGEIHEVRVEEAARFALRTRGGAAGERGGQVLKAPLPGKISHVAVKAGDAVTRGDTLLVIEAMKMENEFKAATAGTVKEVRVTAGQAVNPGDVLVVIA